MTKYADSKSKKTVLVYDRINKIGGAERILAALYELYPKSPLYSAVYHSQKATWANDWDIHPSFVNKLLFAKSTHELYPWLMPLAFESFVFNDVDMVVSVTSAEAKGIVSKPETLHVCYCLTPTRYLWHDHARHIALLPKLLQHVSYPVFHYLRKWDRIASQRPDFMLAISKTTQQRIRKYYQRESDVIYPPVDVDKYSKKRNSRKNLPFAKYYLVVSRLVAYKNVELAIRACNQLKKHLIIVGTGLQMRILRSIAGPTIYFAGQLTDDDLVLYYQNCSALLFPQQEDFGITVVEAQAAGKPVIAYNQGGATETIIEGRTGIFFSQPTVNSLVAAIQIFEDISFDSKNCKTNAKRFNKSRFILEFKDKMEELWEQHQEKNAL